MQAAQAAGNWLEAFNFVEIGGAKTSYTVKRLEPDALHAFIVATIAANGAATYSEWIFHTTPPPPTTPTPTPPPTPTSGDECNHCPITGLPLCDGYIEIEGAATWGLYSITLNRVETPETVAFVDSDGTKSDDEPPIGRRWLDVKVRVDNDMPWTVTLNNGKDYILDTDAGNGFSWNGDVSTRSGYYHPDLGLLFDVPNDATVAILAIRPIIASRGSDNAPELFYIPIPAP